MELSIIFPVRAIDEVYDFFERLEGALSRSRSPAIERIVVDYGSPPEGAKRVADLAAQYGARYRYASSYFEPFSIGRARDLGVQMASAPVVFFNDIDFFATAQMYQKIVDEAVYRKITVKKYDFFCVPVIFLTEQGFADFKAIDDPLEVDRNPHHWAVNGDRRRIQFTAYGSSAMVVNKAHYLALGGHDRSFLGHGAEDYELLHRLASYYKLGPRSASYYIDTKSNDITTFKGFRAYFALYGVEAFQRGVVMTHLWHPTRQIPGYRQSARNFSLLSDSMKSFDQVKKQPYPLDDLSTGAKTLLLVEPSSPSVEMLRHAYPHMGAVVCFDEADFQSGKDVETAARDVGASTIGFLNPYGNPHRLKLYEHIRTTDLKYWVFDRGALPESWFFDPSGFNADSASYSEDKWNAPLSLKQTDAVHDYMRKIHAGGATLEKNAPRRGVDYWKESLKIGGKRVVFAALQRPHDSVIQYFSKNCGGAEGFLRWLNALARTIDKTKTVIVVKKHPLEDDLGGQLDSSIIQAPADANVYDLLELSDHVVTINSGVGLLAMLFNRPVILCGEAFYAFDGLNVTVKSVDELCGLKAEDLPFDRETRDRFIYYLLKQFYSFGRARYQEVVSKHGKRLRIAREIEFEDLVISGRRASFRTAEAERGKPLDALLFYSFGGRPGIAKAAQDASEGAPMTMRQRATKVLYRATIFPFIDTKSRTRSSIDFVNYLRYARHPVNVFFKRLAGL